MRTCLQKNMWGMTYSIYAYICIYIYGLMFLAALGTMRTYVQSPFDVVFLLEAIAWRQQCWLLHGGSSPTFMVVSISCLLTITWAWIWSCCPFSHRYTPQTFDIDHNKRLGKILLRMHCISDHPLIPVGHDLWLISSYLYAVHLYWANNGRKLPPPFLSDSSSYGGFHQFSSSYI